MQLAVAEFSTDQKVYIPSYKIYKEQRRHHKPTFMGKLFTYQNVNVTISIYTEILDKNGTFPIFVYAYFLEYKSNNNSWQITPSHIPEKRKF